MKGLRRLADLAGLCIAAGLAWWAYQRVDLQALGEHLREGDRPWIAAAFGVLLFCHALRVHRWSALCASAGVGRFGAAVAAPIGLLAITLLPFRLGEGVRLALQRRIDPDSRLGALAGLTLVERAGDLLGILALVAIGAAAAGSLLPAAGLASGTVAVAVLARPIARVTGRYAARGPLAPAMRLANLLVERRSALPQVGAISVLAWFGDAVAVACLARAFGSAVSLGASSSAAGWVALGVALPTAPAGLGTHQAIMGWALQDAAPLDLAVAVSLAMTGLVVVAQAGLSLVALGASITRASYRRPRSASAG